MIRATVEDSTAGLSQTLRIVRPLVGGLSFHGVSGLCTNSPAHGLPGGIQAQGTRRRPIRAWVPCPVGQLPVVRTVWVALSGERGRPQAQWSNKIRGSCATPRVRDVWSTWQRMIPVVGGLCGGEASERAGHPACMCEVARTAFNVHSWQCRLTRTCSLWVRGWRP